MATSLTKKMRGVDRKVVKDEDKFCQAEESVSWGEHIGSLIYKKTCVPLGLPGGEWGLKGLDVRDEKGTMRA